MIHRIFDNDNDGVNGVLDKVEKLLLIQTLAVKEEDAKKEVENENGSEKQRELTHVALVK